MCSTCAKAFANDGDLGKHVKTHAPGEVRCELDGCTYVGPNAAALRFHQTRTIAHRDDAPLPYVCAEPGCTYGAQFKCILDKHTETVHSTDRPFVCEDPCCPLLSVSFEPCAFKTAGDLKKHVDNVHETEYSVACTEAGCGRSFKTLRHMHLHLTTVHCDRTFACEECDATFRTKMHCAMHQVLHSTDRPFVCLYAGCASTFQRKSTLDTHIAWMHDFSARYNCPQCEWFETSPTRLRTHIANAHVAKDTTCRSKGEVQLARHYTLCQWIVQMNFIPAGCRFSFDFLLRLPLSANKPTLVEYDGKLHFSVFSSAPKHGTALLSQVQRDLVKSRRCRASDLHFVRLTRDVSDMATVISATQSEPNLLTFDDYVFGQALCSPIAQFIRERVRDGAVADLSAFDAALTLLQFLDDADALHTDLSEEGVEQFGDAVLMLVLVHWFSIALSIDRISSSAMRAAQRIACTMPEFNDAVSFGQPFPAIPTFQDAIALPPPKPLGCIKSHSCWLCKDLTPVYRADVLLQHVNASHGARYLVRCAYCPRTFECQAFKNRLACHGTDCISAADSRETQCNKSRCGVGACEFSASEHFRLLRHFNDHHDARFDQWSTFKCGLCGFQGAKNASTLKQHLKSAHGEDSLDWV